MRRPRLLADVQLLKLSDRFIAPDVRKYAILLLDQHPGFAKMPPIYKLVLCKEASASQWFTAPFTALAHQSFPTVLLHPHEARDGNRRLC